MRVCTVNTQVTAVTHCFVLSQLFTTGSDSGKKCCWYRQTLSRQVGLSHTHTHSSMSGEVADRRLQDPLGPSELSVIQHQSQFEKMKMKIWGSSLCWSWSIHPPPLPHHHCFFSMVLCYLLILSHLLLSNTQRYQIKSITTSLMCRFPFQTQRWNIREPSLGNENWTWRESWFHLIIYFPFQHHLSIWPISAFTWM